MDNEKSKHRWTGEAGGSVDTIVAVDDNLPVFDNITGQLITLPGHKIDGTITN